MGALGRPVRVQDVGIPKYLVFLSGHNQQGSSSDVLICSLWELFLQLLSSPCQEEDALTEEVSSFSSYAIIFSHVSVKVKAGQLDKNCQARKNKHEEMDTFLLR